MIIIDILFALFLLILIPTYWKTYGPQNFLWLSDIGLFLTALAFWFKSPLLMSMACLGVAWLEILWGIDFFIHLITGYKFLNISHYMFSQQLSYFVKGLSLFHLILPFIWFYYLYEWGYDHRALVYQTLLFWMIILLTYFLSEPQENINWVFIPKIDHWTWMPMWVWLIILLIGFPVLIFWPTHLLFKYLFIKTTV